MDRNSALKGLACLVSAYMVSGCGEVIKEGEDSVNLSFLPSPLKCKNYFRLNYSEEDAVYKVVEVNHFCQTSDGEIGARVTTVYDSEENLSEISYSRFKIVDKQDFNCTSSEGNSECAKVFEEIEEHLKNSEQE